MLDKNTSVLGRGLSSLIPNKITAQSEKDNPENKQKTDILLDKAGNINILEININKIKANPFQPRQNFNHHDLEDLINSIKEHGILQPLVVSRNKDGLYELIAGERRLRAAKIAALKTVPVIVREVNEQKKLELALIENIQRKDLNPLEEAMAYKKLMDEFSLTQENVSKKVGKSLPVIANSLRLLNLPEEVRTALIEGKIDKTAARTIAGLDNKEEQIKIFKELLEKGINVRMLENYVRSRKPAKRRKFDVVNYEIEEKRNLLQAALGTKVKIEEKGGNGKIIIEFYSNEEMAEIVKKIIQKN